MRKKDKSGGPLSGLSRREREVLEILFARGEATAAEVHAAMADSPSYSAVRAQLRILEEKGHVRHVADAGRYIYVPTLPKGYAGRSALDQVLKTFFGGSIESAISALISSKESRMSEDEYERLLEVILKAREEKTT